MRLVMAGERGVLERVLQRLDPAGAGGGGEPDQLGQVIEPRHVAMMNTMMRETLLSGTARKAEIPGWMAAGKTGNFDQIKGAVGSVGQSCKSCHDDFRKD